MNPLHVQARQLPNTKRMRLALTLTTILLALPLFLHATAANAGGGSGFFDCAKTRIADVSELTITEGAAALGLNALASVLPPDVAALLDTSENITVFAPTDEAFGEIPPDILNAIAGDTTVLNTVLAYHVSPKLVDPRRVGYVRKIDTLADQTLFVSRTRSGPMVNQSSVECQGYRTANGLVWIIDSVLLPQF